MCLRISNTQCPILRKPVPAQRHPHTELREPRMPYGAHTVPIFPLILSFSFPPSLPDAAVQVFHFLSLCPSHPSFPASLRLAHLRSDQCVGTSALCIPLHYIYCAHTRPQMCAHLTQLSDHIFTPHSTSAHEYSYSSPKHTFTLHTLLQPSPVSGVTGAHGRVAPRLAPAGSRPRSALGMCASHMCMRVLF